MNQLSGSRDTSYIVKTDFVAVLRTPKTVDSRCAFAFYTFCILIYLRVNS